MFYSPRAAIGAPLRQDAAAGNRELKMTTNERRTVVVRTQLGRAATQEMHVPFQMLAEQFTAGLRQSGREGRIPRDYAFILRDVQNEIMKIFFAGKISRSGTPTARRCSPVFAYANTAKPSADFVS